MVIQLSLLPRENRRLVRAKSETYLHQEIAAIDTEERQVLKSLKLKACKLIR